MFLRSLYKTSLADGGCAHVAAARIIEAIGRPVPIGAASARGGASIGLALFAPGGQASPEQPVREADERMYQARRAGKGRKFPEPRLSTDA